MARPGRNRRSLAIVLSQGNSQRNRRGKSPIQFIQRERSVFLPRPLHPTLPDCCVPGGGSRSLDRIGSGGAIVDLPAVQNQGTGGCSIHTDRSISLLTLHREVLLVISSLLGFPIMYVNFPETTSWRLAIKLCSSRSVYYLLYLQTPPP